VEEASSRAFDCLLFCDIVGGLYESALTGKHPVRKTNPTRKSPIGQIFAAAFHLIRFKENITVIEDEYSFLYTSGIKKVKNETLGCVDKVLLDIEFDI
jgi:hypothetical protein